MSTDNLLAAMMATMRDKHESRHGKYIMMGGLRLRSSLRSRGHQQTSR